MIKNLVIKFIVSRWGFSFGSLYLLKDKYFVFFNFAIGYGENHYSFGKYKFYLHINPPQFSNAGIELKGINIVK